ncbi:sulfotransferase domain-containing protein [Xanthomarina sp. F2636L]|uniref:sulfotransferase domain-containing protein n=1 Tax=Xanthomarina sp. F2636L TaxID=2996018 RepID=UPI00225E288E|nr:sulfotransferase domain-containing protein [Xanthomarina sp. F2636L]MCX7551329.1 sulfotransferase [Xanthomarina sp. F2636L]
MNNDLPNFLIVGTAKAATTTIHEYLKQHPNVFMTDWKEPSFFKFKDKKNISFTTGRPVKFVTEIKAYKALFEDGRDRAIRGESSTPYLYFYKETIDNIRKTIPNHKDVKILIILRNPIERAFSQYMMKVRDLVEDKSFLEAVKSEKTRMEQNAHFDFFYVDRGFYYNQVKAYLEEFNSVKIVLYDDFKKNPDRILDEVVTFLDLDKIQFKKIGNQNISGRPKVKLISRLQKEDSFLKSFFKNIVPKKLRIEFTSFIQKKNLEKENIDQESKYYLQGLYLENIKSLEKLIDRDLSKWLE